MVINRVAGSLMRVRVGFGSTSGPTANTPAAAHRSSAQSPPYSQRACACVSSKWCDAMAYWSDKLSKRRREYDPALPDIFIPADLPIPKEEFVSCKMVQWMVTDIERSKLHRPEFVENDINTWNWKDGNMTNGIMTRGVAPHKNVVEVKLHDCGIYGPIPTAICVLTHLRVLALPHNQITEVPQSIECLQALVFINLNSNEIEKLPNEICELIHLECLSIPFNRLKRLPQDIDKLQNLRIM